MPEPSRRTTPTTASATPSAARLPLLLRLQSRWLEAASLRAHDRVVASGGEAAGWHVGRAALVVVSVLVLATAAAVLVLLARWTFTAKGVLGWAGVVVAWAGLVAMLPGRGRPEARVLPADGFPEVHRVVGEVAAAVGVRPPGTIAVTTDLSAGVLPVGWRGEPWLLLGLPLWTCCSPAERLALLGHELGHLRGRDTVRGRIVGAAHGVLSAVVALLSPLPSRAYTDFADYWVFAEQSNGLMNRFGALLQRVVSLPFVLLLLAFGRLEATNRQRDEYLADVVACRLAGTDAVRRLLATVSSVSGLWTVTGAAVRRGEDAFEALDTVAARPPLTAPELAAVRERARAEGHRWDASHPSDDLRMSVVESLPHLPGNHDPARLEAADRELRGVRGELTKAFRDELVTSWY